MRSMKFVWVGLFCLASLTAAHGQQPGEPWTLDRCIAHGLQNNIQVRQGQLDVLSSEISTKQSQMERLPSANASTSVGTNLGRSINPFTNQFTEGTIVSQSLRANASMTLFSGFTIHNTIQRNRINEEASQYSLEATKNQVTLDVIGFYTQVLFNREQLAAAKARLATSRAQLENTQTQVKLGVLPEANLLQAEQQVASDEVQVINFQNAAQLALLQLKQLIMVNPAEEFDIVNPTLTMPANTTLMVTVQQIFEEAVATQPSIKAVDARIESAAYDVKIANGGLYPTLSAGITYSTAYSSQAFAVPVGTDSTDFMIPIGVVTTTGDQVVTTRRLPTNYEELNYFGQLDFNSSTNVGATLSIPIFSNYRTKAQIEQAKISLERAEVNAINSRNQLRQSIEQAYQNVLAAKQTYQANQNQVLAQQNLFNNVDQRYQLGAANSVEFAQARNNLSSAENDLIRAKYDYLFSLKVLDFYQNKPLTF